MGRMRLPLVATLLVTVLLAGCSSPVGVKATDDAFVPNVLNLKKGEEVKVNNAGDHLHTVTIHKVGDPASKTLQDTQIQSGTSTSFKIAEPGTYHVFCRFHSQGGNGAYNAGMVLTISVT